MGEKFPSQGLSINKHPVFNLSNYQQKWQAALTERTVVQRNIASLSEGFFINHSSKIALLQAHFSGVNLFNGIAKACVEAFPVQVGDPTFRKAVMNLLNKTSKSGDGGKRIPQLTEKEATEMMTTIIEYGKQYTQLHTERANVVKYNLLSLMSGDIPVIGQLDSLSYSVKHVGLNPGALKNPLDLGAQSDNPSDWLKDLSYVHTYPRAIAWNGKVGIRHKDWWSPAMAYKAKEGKYPTGESASQIANIISNYPGGKFFKQFGPKDAMEWKISTDKNSLDKLDANLWSLTGTVPDNTGGRIVPISPVTLQQLQSNNNNYEGVYLQPMLFFYAKAYGRTSNPIEFWKTNAKFRIQGFQEGNVGIAYLVPVNPITGGATAPGIPVAKKQGSASDAMLLAKKYYPHVMGMEDGNNPILHPDLVAAFSTIGQTKFHDTWKTAPKNYKASQRYAVLLYSVWTWPHEHLMSMSDDWKAFDSEYAAAVKNSRGIEDSQNKILSHFLQPNNGGIGIDKTYTVKGKTKENQLLYGRPSVPSGTHQTDIMEVYTLDESIESGMMKANKAIQEYYLKACQEWEKTGGSEDSTKQWNKKLIVTKCAFGILNSALWLRKGGFKSMENSMGVKNTMETYGVPSYFPEKICQEAISIIAPHFSPASPKLAMKVPINDLSDVETVMQLFFQQYGSMPELVVPDSQDVVVATKENYVWWPLTLNNKNPSGATLQNNLTEVTGSRTNKNPFALLNASDVRPFFPYYEYAPNLKIAGREGNILQVNNVWATRVVRRIPYQARGMSRRFYGKRNSPSTSVSMQSVDSITVQSQPPTAEDFETVKGVAIGTGSIAVAVAMMLIGRKWGM
jgi:hypothetical protein